MYERSDGFKTHGLSSSEDSVEVAVVIEAYHELWQPRDLEHEDVLETQHTHTHTHHTMHTARGVHLTQDLIH